MTLDEAKATDLAVNDESVAAAEAAATEAEQAAATLEESAIKGGKGSAAPGTVNEARAVAEFARKRAARLRVAADQAREAKRLLDLEQLGTEAEAFAGSALGRTGIQDAIAAIAAARTELLALVDEHNEKVRELAARAHRLGATPQPLNGILDPASAYVHIGFGGGVRTPAVNLHHLDRMQVGHAITLAIGDQASSLKDAISALGPIAETFTVPEGQA